MGEVLAFLTLYSLKIIEPISICLIIYHFGPKSEPSVQRKILLDEIILGVSQSQKFMRYVIYLYE